MVLGIFILLVIGAYFVGSHQQGKVVTDKDLGTAQIHLPSLGIDDNPDEYIACTADAKICPDGSGVGRVGPDCEFAACPDIKPEPVTPGILCTEEQKRARSCTEEYQPVCGHVQVQCFTTPCNPVPETFGNDCLACAQGNVIFLYGRGV